MQTTILKTGFNTLDELIKVLQHYAEYQNRMEYPSPMYISDAKGNSFNSVDLLESKLTDGSIVYDVCLVAR